MASGGNLIAAPANYDPPGNHVVLTGVVDRVNLIVSNGPIYYQLQQASPDGRAPVQGAWYPERYIPCGLTQTAFVSLARRCTGIRVRSANFASFPAIVSLELVPKAELGRA